MISSIPFTIDDRESISKVLSIVKIQDEVIQNQSQKINGLGNKIISLEETIKSLEIMQ